MGWYSKPRDYKCNECGEEFKFEFDTLFIASHGGLPVKCPNCKSENVERILKEVNLIGHENKINKLGMRYTEVYIEGINTLQFDGHIESSEELCETLKIHGYKLKMK